jgi:hypothetical protein
MKDKKIKLIINSKWDNAYGKLCNGEGQILFRQFEKCMEVELEKRGREK